MIYDLPAGVRTSRGGRKKEMKAKRNSRAAGGVRYGPEMRILVAGGGIAGLTLCGLLERRGFSPVLAERAPGFGSVGYVIVVWPSGSRILKGLGLYEKLRAASREFTCYNISNSDGETINRYSIDPVVEKYGPIMSVYRPDLISILKEAVNPDSVRLGAEIVSLERDEGGVTAVFGDGTRETYDLVVGCDGIRSAVRRAAFGEVPLSYSGMSGWGFWVRPDLCGTDGIVEYWGKGKFLGIWPTRGRLAVFTSVRAPAGGRDRVDARVENIRRAFAGFGGVVPDILRGLGDPRDIYYDEYSDLRMKRWSRGGVVLVGDSAHAVLPSAGTGASMAMESAAVLAEELCRTDSGHLASALELYESRRRSRVEKVQNQSRLMGKFMCTESETLSVLRNCAMRICSGKRLFRYWDDMLRDPI